MKLTATLSLCLMLLITACGTSMPAERPADFSIEFYEGGGMNPESEEIFISGDSAVYRKWFNSAKNHVTMNVTPAELDTLWEVLRAQNAIKIEGRQEGEVYDRGGVTIRIEYGMINHQILNSGSHFIPQRLQRRYNTVVQAIWELAERHLSQKRIAVPFRIENHAIDSSDVKYINVAVDGQPVYNWEVTRDEPAAIVDAEAKLLPGPHEVSCWAEIDSVHVSELKVVMFSGAGDTVLARIMRDSIIIR